MAFSFIILCLSHSSLRLEIVLIESRLVYSHDLSVI